MDYLNRLITAARDGGLEELDAAQLAEIAGGFFLPTVYLGTWITSLPLPWRPLPFRPTPPGF